MIEGQHDKENKTAQLLVGLGLICGSLIAAFWGLLILLQTNPADSARYPQLIGILTIMAFGLGVILTISAFLKQKP